MKFGMMVGTRNVGTSGIVAAAISAVDIAVWDLSARRLHVGIGDLFGRARSSVPVYGSGGFTTYDDRTTAASVKIKIGESFGSAPQRDLSRTAFARRVVGDTVALFVDANGGYTVGQAIRMEAALRDQGVTWFEEPVSSERPEQLAAVRRQATADIAAGEYVWRLADARVLLEHGAVDCLQLDVTRCGGYSGWFEAAALAAAYGLDVSAHCAPHLAVHAAVATPNARHIEYFIDHERVDDALFDGLPGVTGGAIADDRGAVGHGISVRADAGRFRVE